MDAASKFLDYNKKTDRADSLQIKLSDSNLIMKIIAKRQEGNKYAEREQ